MDKKRYTADEKKLNNADRDDINNSGSVHRDRNSALAGYKKLLLIVMVFTLICCFRANVFDRIIVSGNSMSPTYEDGDVMWARKFNIKELKRYQVVVADIRGKFVIKRVIGLPCETIQIKDGYVYINGEILKDDYGYPTEIYGCADEKITLKENEYFIMGDNRDNSTDCRMWGPVNIKSIKGIIIFRFFPFWKIGKISC